ncbi:hypothetical protein GCM10027215_29750 [Nocardioides zeae]
MTPRRTDSWVTTAVFAIGIPWFASWSTQFSWWAWCLLLLALVFVALPLVHLTVYVVLSLTEDAVRSVRRRRGEDPRPDAV